MSRRKNMTKQRNTKKKSMTALVMVCVLLCTAAMGTIAWLTAQNTLENTFTVGEINPVDPEKTGPEGEAIPEDPDPADPEVELSDILDGNLYEPDWKPASKLLPGATIAKNPYVGVGAESEESYAFVNVTNSMTNNGHIYFELKEGWSVVENTGKTVVMDGKTYYISGLFVYDETLTGAAGENTWTKKPVFENIIVAEEAVAEDFLAADESIGKITVQSFVHQAKSGDAVGTSLEKEAKDAALVTFGYKTI